MNVCMNPYAPSMAIERIAKALWAYSPQSISWVEFSEADFIIFPVIGRHDHLAIQTRDILKQGRKYAIIQLSLKSTRNPDSADWLDIWREARVVWSYYNLPGDFNFYYAPLGAHPKSFFPLNLERKYIIGTTGKYTRAESLWEIEKAARMVDKKMLKIRALDDEELNIQYNQCHYINGLRRKEGFELPCVEGLLAGARPILYDTPDYRHWYDGLAEFIAEDNILAVMNDCIYLFKSETTPVTNFEIKEAQSRFDWRQIIQGFWEQCL